MKQLIIVVGNMGSGKSTLARMIAEKLPEYTYVCLDDNRRKTFDDVLSEAHNPLEYEAKVADLTRKELQRHDRIIYETTGATRFFKDMHYQLQVAKAKMYIVKLKCSPSTCLQRHNARERGGHFHVIPQYGQQLSPEDLINRFDSKSAWIVPQLELDSETNTPDQLLRLFMRAYFPSDHERDIKELLKDFRYEEALKWVNDHVPGKAFVKQVLAQGEDSYNVQTLKTLLGERLEELQSQPAAMQEHISDATQRPISISQARKRNTPPGGSSPQPYLQTQSERDLKDKWSPLYREAFYTFTQLDHEKDDAKRCKMVHEILDLMDQVSDMWKEQDFIRQYGKVPNYDKAGMEQLTPEQAATRIRTLRTYISKTKRGILKKDIPTLEKEIEDLSQHLHAI